MYYMPDFMADGRDWYYCMSFNRRIWRMDQKAKGEKEMTLREKVAMEEPDKIRVSLGGGVCGCPGDYDYLNRPNCDSLRGCPRSSGIRKTCTECWSQEFIPVNNEEKENETMNFTMEPKSTKKTKTQLIEEINDLKKELARMEKYRQYEDVAGEMYAFLESFMNAGFTREEAFTMLTVSMKTTMRR